MSRRLLVLLVAGLMLSLAIPVAMYVVVLGGGDEQGLADCTPGDLDVTVPAGGLPGLSEAQARNAATIIAVGNQRRLPRQGLVVALAVASQESRFLNYANDGQGGDLRVDQLGIAASLDLPHEAVGTDHGSLGIFQQQWPWWGSMGELMDPAVAAGKFFDALVRVPGWEALSVTRAGQAVQGSAFPNAYADDEEVALRLLDDPALAGSTVTPAALDTPGCGPVTVDPGTVAMPLPATASYVDNANFGNAGSMWSREHTGTDFSTPCGTPVLAAHAGTVAVLTDQAWSGRWLVQVSTGVGRLTTWYAHMQSLDVADGDTVEAGEQLGEVGDLGNATGCHLHFEVHPRGGTIYADDVDPTAWLAGHLGDDLDADIVPAGQTDDLDGSVSVLTANVPWTGSALRAREQLLWLLAQEPDVMVLQEVRTRDVTRIVASAPGRWGVYEPQAPRRGSAIVWNADRLRLVQRGIEVGFLSAAYDRWMPWAALESTSGGLQLAVVALHLPNGASRFPGARANYVAMTRRYQDLAGRLHDAGYPVVLGADWNHPLDVPKEPWSPVPMLAEVGMTTNWRQGTPCSQTSIHGGRIDGLAYDPDRLRLLDQGCLERHLSDHRPVWVRVAPR